ncbi:hypothetical protein HDU89_005918 [Geranomyces variabilis]|nr:hypothetical protein HDU89_005918 [Geranomyces variabilis]
MSADQQDSTFTIAWSPGLIVTSFLVSTAGAWVALELIRLRTSNQGWLNWMLLILASLVTGALATFVMHFVGMAAFSLQGPTDLPIYFHTGLTVGSLFEPIFCISIGVYATGAQEHPSLRRLFAGGACAALGITLMHFTAMRAMRLSLDWIPTLVALSCAISLLATTSTLVLFFRLRAMWQNSLLKQTGCAVMLAGAICAMHYTGMVAASYTIDPQFLPGTPDLLDGTLSITGVLHIGLGLSALCFCIMIGLLALRLQRYWNVVHEQKAQLKLAVLCVDSCGRIMVDALGHLPSRAVIGEFDFNSVRVPIAHPALLWMLKASTCWAKFTHLNSAFRKHGGRVTSLLTELLAPSHLPKRGVASESFEQSRLPFFRLSLIQAVSLLAGFIGVPLQDMGVLHDKVLKAREGWVAFLVDRYDERRVRDLTAKGFRWTEPKLVLQVLGRQLLVSPVALKAIISDAEDFVRTRRRPVRAGLHVGLLSVYPRISGFEVLVPTRDRSNIPSVELSPIAFSALLEHASCLKDFLSPILMREASAAMVVADYVAASEILSALTRMGVGLDASSPINLQVLSPPEDVLVLHRRGKHKGGPNGSVCESNSERASYKWVSRVPLEAYRAAPNSCDTDMLLFVRIHSFSSAKFSPPSPGFQLIDLAAFEAMNYSRCFPDRFRRILGLEMSTEWDDLIMPTFLQLDKATGTQSTDSDSDMNDEDVTQVDLNAGGSPKEEHAVIDVEQMLREGPAGGDPPAIDWQLRSDSAPKNVAKRGASLIRMLKAFPPQPMRRASAVFSEYSSSGATGGGSGVTKGGSEKICLDDFPVLCHTDIYGDNNGDDEFSDSEDSIPQAIGPHASQVANAWQAMRWVKLYVNAALQFTGPSGPGGPALATTPMFVKPPPPPRAKLEQQVPERVVVARESLSSTWFGGGTRRKDREAGRSSVVGGDGSRGG